MSDDLLLKAHHYSSGNMPLLEKAKLCGCFYCLKIFSTQKITEYLQDDNIAIDKDGTALCPYCGVDSVIPQNDDYPLSEKFLKQMHKKWF